nr:hypothetical protein [Tanacetum cinerariifolium]
FRLTSFVKSKGALDLCSLIIFIGKRTNVNVRSCGSTKVDESKLCDIPVVFKGGARVSFEDEFGAAEEREVLCKAQQGQSGVKRKLFRSFRNKIGDVRSLIIEEAHAMKYSVRRGAEIGESKMIPLEMEQETTKVVMIKERLKEAKDRQKRVKLIVGNQTFRI